MTTSWTTRSILSDSWSRNIRCSDTLTSQKGEGTWICSAPKLVLVMLRLFGTFPLILSCFTHNQPVVQVLMIDIVEDRGGSSGSSGGGADGVASGSALVRKAVLSVDFSGQSSDGTPSPSSADEQSQQHKTEQWHEDPGDDTVRSLVLAKAVAEALQRRDADDKQSGARGAEDGCGGETNRQQPETRRGRDDKILINIMHPAPSPPAHQFHNRMYR